jgi:hypothetical protein
MGHMGLMGLIVSHRLIYEYHAYNIFQHLHSTLYLQGYSAFLEGTQLFAALAAEILDMRCIFWLQGSQPFVVKGQTEARQAPLGATHSEWVAPNGAAINEVAAQLQMVGS